ncbi:hypothetical protein JNJ66_06815 [Candidatus Saccharibacteria bacterium]|nr:hypothetical protein [Candidatus Saccharibacteria bacterium]
MRRLRSALVVVLVAIGFALGTSGVAAAAEGHDAFGNHYEDWKGVRYTHFTNDNTASIAWAGGALTVGAGLVGLVGQAAAGVIGVGIGFAGHRDDMCLTVATPLNQPTRVVQGPGGRTMLAPKSWWWYLEGCYKG